MNDTANTPVPGGNQVWRWAGRHPLATLLVVVFLVQLPFALTMPFHIDDSFFVRLVRNIDRQPANPLGLPFHWDGQVNRDALLNAHPPLVVYFMYPFFKLGGARPDVGIHLGLVAFSLLFAGAMFRLMEFYGLPRHFGALLAFLSPAVLTVSHTAMMDMPTLAFGTAGITAAFFGLRDDRPGRVLLGGFFIGCALLTSYTALLYLGPPFLAVLARPKRLRNLFLLGVLPALALGGWLCFVYLQTGLFVVAEAIRVIGSYQGRSYGGWDVRLTFNLTTAGLLVLFPVSMLAWRSGRLRRALYLAAVPAAGCWLAWRFPENGAVGHLVGAVSLAAGVALLVEGPLALLRARRLMDAALRPFLLVAAVWLPGFFLLTVKAWPHGAVRYLVWIVPPAVVALGVSLFVKKGRAGAGPFRGRNLLAGLLFAGQLALGLAVAAADADLAQGCRQVFRDATRRFGKPGHTVWYAGEWGMRCDAAFSGARLLVRYDRRVKPGDVVLKPAYLTTTYPVVFEEPSFGRRIARVKVTTSFPLRTLNPDARAGFWSDYWGVIPVAVATKPAPLEVLDVFRVLRTPPPDPVREKENRGIMPPLGEITEIPE